MSMTLSIVGAGRVGRALGRALRQCGWHIGTVLTNSKASAREAVRAIGGGHPEYRIDENLFAADVILFATPDKDIEITAGVLSLALYPGTLSPAEMSPAAEALARRALRGKVVLHTSGSLNADVLGDLAFNGAATGTMHPFQTFGRGATTRLGGVVFGLGGDAPAVRMAQRMVRSLGGVPVRVKPEKRATYHLSGGYPSQHLLVVLECGVRILMDVGLSRKHATQALLVMARQTLENFERRGARMAWTGPIPRGDYGTVAKHIAALRRFPVEYRAAYVALTRVAVRMLSSNPRRVLKEVDCVLDS